MGDFSTTEVQQVRIDSVIQEPYADDEAGENDSQFFDLLCETSSIEVPGLEPATQLPLLFKTSSVELSDVEDLEPCVELPVRPSLRNRNPQVPAGALARVPAVAVPGAGDESRPALAGGSARAFRRCLVWAGAFVVFGGALALASLAPGGWAPWNAGQGIDAAAPAEALPVAENDPHPKERPEIEIFAPPEAPRQRRPVPVPPLRVPKEEPERPPVPPLPPLPVPEEKRPPVPALPVPEEKPESGLTLPRPRLQMPDERWFATVSALNPFPAATSPQVRRVEKKLAQMNPGFHVRLTPQENFSYNLNKVGADPKKSAIVRLTISTDHLSNLAAIAAFTQLQKLECRGSAPGKGKLRDLSPLQHTRIETLDCRNNAIDDFSVLKHVPILRIWCDEANRHWPELRQIETLRRVNGHPVPWKPALAGLDGK